MICCPISDIMVSIPSTNSSRLRSNLTNHPNAKLLDLHKCGIFYDDKTTIGFGYNTQPFEFPWMIMIRKVANAKLATICSGSLISRRYILTAAHCMKTAQGPIPIHSVVLGEHNTATERDCIEDDCADQIQIIAVELQIPHPNFTVATAQNDIGLLRLQHNAQLSDSVTPICLPYTTESQTVSDNLRKIIVTGWGITEKQSTSPILLKTIIDVTPLSECASIYKQRHWRVTIDSKRLCAFNVKSGSCVGDSGSPAVFIVGNPDHRPRMVQFGIVSVGTKTCGNNTGIPGLYTRVTSYMKWILDNIND